MSFKIVIIEGVPLAQLKTMVDVSNLAAVLNMFNVDSGQKRIE
jgi:hypothetical protein